MDNSLILWITLWQSSYGTVPPVVRTAPAADLASGGRFTWSDP
ncbi:unnamed protein product [[Actinomadura] parvosata subsp. kistnae]|nr:unnamed protein product [Actinomadura parvosata subsp. kistnae]